MKPYFAVIVLNKNLCRFVRVVVITLHKSRSVNTKLAVLAFNFICSSRFNGHSLNIVARNADTTLRCFSSRVGKWANGYTFRKAVAWNEVAVSAVFLKKSIHFFSKRIRNNVSAWADKLHIRHINSFEITCLIYLFKEIRNAENIVDTVFLDSVWTHFSVKLRKQRLRHTCADWNVHTKRKAKTVEYGKCSKHSVWFRVTFHI